jgi:hypothetical protein
MWRAPSSPRISPDGAPSNVGWMRGTGSLGSTRSRWSSAWTWKSTTAGSSRGPDTLRTNWRPSSVVRRWFWSRSPSSAPDTPNSFAAVPRSAEAPKEGGLKRRSSGVRGRSRTTVEIHGHSRVDARARSGNHEGLHHLASLPTGSKTILCVSVSYPLPRSRSIGRRATARADGSSCISIREGGRR